MRKNWKLITGIGLLICTLLLALFFYFSPKKTDPTLTSSVQINRHCLC